MRLFFFAAANWETGFLVLCAVFLLYQVWKGWRLGVIRAGLRLLALVGSGVVGWYGGMWAGGAWASTQPVLQYVVWAIVGITLSLIVYIALQILSMLCFKKTADHSSPTVRLGFGIGGALLGLFIGLVFVWAAISGIRAFGGMTFGAPSPSDNTPPSALAGLKKTLENGFASGLIQSTDPIPQSSYDLIAKFSKITSNPQAVLRLTEYPDVADFLQHPKFLALVKDPSVQAAAQKKDVMALMTNPKVFELASDPALLADIQKINWSAALDYALTPPSSSTKNLP